MENEKTIQTELTREDLEGVAGGYIIENPHEPLVNVQIKEIHCPYCSFSIKYNAKEEPFVTGDMQMHIMRNHERPI